MLVFGLFLATFQAPYRHVHGSASSPTHRHADGVIHSHGPALETSSGPAWKSGHDSGARDLGWVINRDTAPLKRFAIVLTALLEEPVLTATLADRPEPTPRGNDPPCLRTVSPRAPPA